MSGVVTLLNELVTHISGASFTSINGDTPTVTRRTVGGSNQQEKYTRPVIEVYPSTIRSQRFDRGAYREERVIRVALVYVIEQEDDTLRQAEEDAYFNVLEELESRVWSFNPTGFSPSNEIPERPDIDDEAFLTQGMMVNVMQAGFTRVVDFG